MQTIDRKTQGARSASRDERCRTRHPRPNGQRPAGDAGSDATWTFKADYPGMISGTRPVAWGRRAVSG